MAGLTNHYQLQRLDRGDPFATNGQKYTTTDRDAIDRLLNVGAENHVHTGVSPANMNPTAGPTLTLDTTIGSLPAGTRVFYKFTWVDPQGFETAASPESYLDTPAPVGDPLAPTLNDSDTGGTLPQGGYFYAVSAYKPVSSAESRATNAYVLVGSSGTSSVTVIFPTVPTGATGWNVYRRAPAASDYIFMASVTAATTSWTDNGSVAGDSNRHLPAFNSTGSSNSITVTVPTVPAGYTWNVYRTTSGQYDNSLLHQVVETTVEGGTVISPNYTDAGASTFAGQPPTTSELIGTAPKINLATMVVGSLPAGSINSFVMSITFAFPGPVVAASGYSVWVNDFATARIVSARCALGRGSHPATQTLICDVLKGSGATPTYSSIYTSSPKPQIASGQQIGAKAPPDVNTMVAGDSLSVDVLQAGGGGTPTDHDLTINVQLVVSGTGLPAAP